jgi:hypothetical protein
VGLLELFASHGQNRFYRELEEWLSTITRLGFAAGDGEGGTDQGAMVALAEHMAERMDAMQALLAQNGAGADGARIDRLTATLEGLSDRMAAMGTPEAALASLAASQERLAAALERQGGEGGGAHVDAESRMRLRSMDVQLLRILEEMSAGRQESLAELRADLAQLTKAVRALRPDAAPARSPTPGRD